MAWLLVFLIPNMAVAADAPAGPIPPAEAPAAMKLPAGFKATLFAGEPDVVQPISMAFDDRGRLWVAECLSYPRWEMNGKPGHDRIVIFEDGLEGHFAKKTVFADNLTNLSSIELGFGGVWACCPPNLIFIPKEPGQDKPGGPPQILLDGWNIKGAQHNVVNRLIWGPDGWLYGLNGIQSKSKVGKPGAADNERIAFDCGVWRYHPTRHDFEVVAWGTTNPWGLDFDEYGEMFITNCVIEHLWHVIPGAHYKRMYGEDPVPHIYQPIQSCADHIHWGGGAWQGSRSGTGVHSEAGGGHAHAGCMVYLGDNWPDQYRNNIFMCNIHGNRVNCDVPEQQGSGYVVHHGADFLFANDPWFRGLALDYGPDGGVFVTDWCDTGECHNHVQVDQSNGRIYKVTYGMPTHVNVDLQKLPDLQLVQMMTHKNQWFIRHARRILQERAAVQKEKFNVYPLRSDFYAALHLEGNPKRQLSALWGLQAIGALDSSINEGSAIALLRGADPRVAAWVIRVLVDDPHAKPLIEAKYIAEQADHKSPIVRLAVASAAQRLTPDDAWPIVSALAKHSEDASDQNLPYMIWYAADHAIGSHLERAGELALSSRIGLVRMWSARRLAESSTDAVVDLLHKELKTTETRKDVPADIVHGLQAALATQPNAPMPKGWKAVAAKLSTTPDDDLKLQILRLSLTFGDAEAKAALGSYAADAGKPLNDRQLALQTLVNSRAKDITPLLHQLLDDPKMAGAAIRALASAGDASSPKAILSHYGTLSADDKRDAIATLASRAASAKELLAAVTANTIPRADLTSLTVRQLLSLKDKAIDAEVHNLWGNIRPTAGDKKQLMAKYKEQLTPEAIKKASLAHGRQIFANTCGACHTLFDAGGNVGPNLTGSQRANLDYVLENVLDPSAIVAKEYLMTTVRTKDNRVISGIVEADNEKSMTLKMPGATEVVQKEQITSRKTESISMMPEGLFGGLNNDDVRDLIAYLASPSQVAPPVEK